jgi:hypothetical protein
LKRNYKADSLTFEKNGGLVEFKVNPDCPIKQEIFFIQRNTKTDYDRNVALF